MIRIEIVAANRDELTTRLLDLLEAVPAVRKAVREAALSVPALPADVNGKAARADAEVEERKPAPRKAAGKARKAEPVETVDEETGEIGVLDEAAPIDKEELTRVLHEHIVRFKEPNTTKLLVKLTGVNRLSL